MGAFGRWSRCWPTSICWTYGRWLITSHSMENCVWPRLRRCPSTRSPGLVEQSLCDCSSVHGSKAWFEIFLPLGRKWMQVGLHLGGLYCDVCGVRLLWFYRCMWICVHRHTRWLRSPGEAVTDLCFSSLSRPQYLLIPCGTDAGDTHPRCIHTCPWSPCQATVVGI